MAQGADIAAQLQSLIAPILQSPKGQQMAQAIMAQISGGGGGDPRAAQAMMMPNEGAGPPVRGGGSPAQMPDPMGRGPVTDMELQDMDTAQQQVTGAPPVGDMTTEEELEQARQGMGMPNTGGVQMAPAQGMNSDGPTQQEIQMLLSKPTEQNVRNFDKLFGIGAANQVLSGQGPESATSAPRGQANMGGYLGAKGAPNQMPNDGPDSEPDSDYDD